MRRRLTLIVLTVTIVSLTVMLWFALDLTSPAHAAQVILSLASTASPFPATTTPTATTQASSNSSGGLDPAVVAALIGIVVAVVAGGFAVFQTIYSAKVQRESAADSAKVQQEIAAMQQRHEQEMERLRRELDEQYK